MKISGYRLGFLTLAGSYLVTIPAGAAFRLGLGNAVAKRSAQLINKSGQSASNPVGDSAVSNSLASCPSGALYDTTPVELSQIRAIDPLGHVAPSPHTFPADHIYFYRSTSAVTEVPLYAPGAIHITSVDSSEVLTASPVFTDYSITFYACKEVRSYFAHVRTLSPSLQLQVGAVDQNCTTYTTGGTFRACSKSTDIAVTAGELLGYFSGGAFDFGSYDSRIAPHAFISPGRHGPLQPYTVCPVDYFTDGIRTGMTALLGRFDGGFPRTALPRCGEINFDIAGTARGDWYKPGAPETPEDPHLSLILNNVTAPQQTISVGTSLPNQLPGFYTFNPVSSGQVARDFAQVTVDGLLYCYESFFDPAGQPFGGTRFIIQLTSATTLRIESQSGNCGAGPWAFTGNAVDFER